MDASLYSRQFIPCIEWRGKGCAVMTIQKVLMSQLRPGMTGEVVSLNNKGSMRQRLQDLGLVDRIGRTIQIVRTFVLDVVGVHFRDFRLDVGSVLFGDKVLCKGGYHRAQRHEDNQDSLHRLLFLNDLLGKFQQALRQFDEGEFQPPGGRHLADALDIGKVHGKAFLAA